MKTINYKEAFNEALTLEGKLSKCYQTFHNYSFNNMLLAYAQVGASPINTYKGWQALGRQVKKGEKAIFLYMPITIKEEAEKGVFYPEGKTPTKTIFSFKNKWFSLNQTDGEDYKLPETEGFNKEKLLANLEIEEVPFTHFSGNVQGFAYKNNVAINPVAQFPFKTLMHEVAHVLLGHTKEKKNDTDAIERSIEEVQAESVAYIICNIFEETDGLSSSRSYIQSWKKENEIDEKSARQVFKVVDQIIKAIKA